MSILPEKKEMMHAVDETWDVVVVGGGASGLAAAVTAAAPDCRVLLLEKCPALGGTTALAIGSVSAAGTALQSAAGIKDSADDFLRDMNDTIEGMGLQERNQEELLKILSRDSGPAVDWIAKLGGSLVGPFTEPRDRVPRMYNIVPNSKSYISVLRQAAVKKRVEIRTGTRALELTAAEGAITGVNVSSASGPQTIRANRAVVLATGDYCSSEPLKRRFMSEALAQVEGVNSESTGDGHLMGVAAGGTLRNMDVSIGPQLRFVSPSRRLWIESLPTFPAIAKLMGVVSRHAPKNFFRLIAKRFLTVHTAPSAEIFRKGAILINQEGRRFTNELQKPSLLAVAVAQQPGKIAYLCFDSFLARIFSELPNYISTAPGIAYATFQDYRALRKDIIHTGQTISRLADRLGMDRTALTETVDRYNRCAEAGEEDEFGRREFGSGFHDEPCYVMGPVMGCFSSVEGGLWIDPGCHVLNSEGKRIPKLYAAGSAGGGLVLVGHGTHIGWALVSGRIAGKNAREEQRPAPG